MKNKVEELGRALSELKKAQELLWSASNRVRDIYGEDDYVFQRIDSHANDIDDTFDDLDDLLDKEKGMVANESNFTTDEGDAWFDDKGWLLKLIPAGCIKDCSGSGRKDDLVAFWVDELGFEKGMPRERAIDWLREFGAWEVEELEEKDDKELAEIVLWEFCNELRDQAYDTSSEELEGVGLPEDVDDWSHEDWILFQTEFSNVSLNN